MTDRIILSEIRKRKIKNIFKGRYFYFFINANSLIFLIKNNFTLHNKNKSAIYFSLIHNLPQNQHDWIMLYPIRITLNAESLYEKYPSFIEKNNKIIYEGKKIDLLKHIIQIDIVKDISLHLPSGNLNLGYEEKINYLYKKIQNYYSFPIDYVDDFYQQIGV